MWQDHLATLHERIHRSRKPWIAAVNGPSVGALDVANRTQIMCSASGDLAEAIDAFAEKRPPRWNGL